MRQQNFPYAKQTKATSKSCEMTAFSVKYCEWNSKFGTNFTSKPKNNSV